MSSKPGIIRNWSLLTISSFVQTVLNFVCVVRIARVLGPEDFGQYTYLLAAATIAQIFAALSLRNVSIREIVRTPAAFPMVARESSKAVAVATFVSGVGLVLFLAMWSNTQTPLLLMLIFVFVISQSIWSITETLAFSRSQMQVSAVLFIVSSVLWLLLIYGVPAELLTLETVFGSFVAVQMLRSLMYLWWEWRAAYFIPSPDACSYSITAKGLLRQSLPILGSALLAVPISLLPVMFLAAYSGMNQVGFYGIANRLTQPLYLISGALFSAIYPSLSANWVQRPDLFRSNALKLLLTLAGAGIGVVAVISCLSKEVVALLFGVKYLPAVIVLSLQVWVVLNWIMHNYLGSLFIAANRERTMVQLSLVNALIIGSAAYAGAHYGAIGLSFALWVAGLVGFTIHWIVLKQMLPGVFSLGDELRIFVPYMTLSVLSYILPDLTLGTRLLGLAGVSGMLWWLFRRQVSELFDIARQQLSRDIVLTREVGSS